MRRFAPLLVVVLLSPGMFIADADGNDSSGHGPVLHFDFDEASKGRLQDRSRFARHGRVFGAKPVRSQGREVLRFDGVDDYVEFAAPPIDPDSGLTIEMWLKADQARLVNRNNRSPLLLGDPAALAVDRSLNLRFSPSRQFFIEYGNGLSAGSHFAGRTFQLNGGWQHIAVVLDDGRIHFYLDGVHYRNEPLHRNLKLVPGQTWKLGGWFAGHVKGEIDDLKIYDRPLSGKELFGANARSRVGPSLEVESKFDLTSTQLDVNLWSWEKPAGEASITLSPVVRNESESQQVSPEETWKTTLVETHPRSGRYRSKTSRDVSDLDKGAYVVTVRQPVKTGEALRATERVEIGKPAWWESPLGRELKVMKPWTPVRVRRPKGTAGTVEVEVWGRSYRFGKGGIIEQVESAGRQMLSAPVELVAQVKNASIEWQGGEARAVTVEETHAVIEQRFTSSVGLQAKLRHRLEFDGFGKTELVIESADPVTINSLALVGHWLPEASDVYFCWPPGKWGSADVLSGRLDSEVVADFKPIVFLGNKDLGFTWYFESYKGWTSWSQPGAVRLIPSSAGESESPKTTESIFTIVDREVLLAPDRSLRIEFGWQATPVKPMVRSGRDLRMFRPEGYCRELDLPEQEIDGVPALQWYAEHGGGGFISWFTGDALRDGDANLEAGSGWVDEEGTIHPTWPIFAKRELLRRLYAVVVDSDPNRERHIDLHLAECFNPSALAYATIGWHGESLPHGGFRNLEKALPEDRIVTEFTGDNVGTDIDMLVHSLLRGAQPQEKDDAFGRIMQQVAPHGIWTRPSTRKQLRMMNEAMPRK